jgi:PKD repeat protein
LAFITQSTDVDLPDSAIFCTGENVVLDANVPTSYVWNTGSTNQSITVTSNGLYSVTVTDLNCVSVDSTYVYEVFNTIPSFTDSSDYFTVWFTNTSQNADTYLWDFGDGTTSTDMNPVHVFPYSTQNVELYMVTLTADNSCGDNEIVNDGVRVGQLVSVSEIELASMISVYPNPNNGVFTVVLKSENSVNVKIEVIDVRGAIVNTVNLGTIQGDFSQEINLDEVATGIYFVRVILNNESAVYRIVVE